MGVYINMEMPKNCGDCKAFVCYRQWAGDVGDCFCGITKNDAEAKKKNADCPLVEIPPHGALMDRDDFFATCPELISGYKVITDELVVIPAEEGE